MSKEKKEVKKLSLDQAMAAINKTYGAASIFEGKENISVQVETRSSGCLAFDSVLCAGIPRGRIIEVAGAEAGGKTLFTLSIIAEWQKKYDAKCAFIDAEQALSPNWAKSLGVNWNELIYTAPDTLEQALDTCALLASTGEVDLICFDSIAAAPSLSEASKAAGDMQVAALSKVLTGALRKLTPIMAKNKCTLVVINQLREKIGAFSPSGGVPTQTPGGRALKHAASLRLEMRKVGGSEIKDGDRIIGHQVNIKCKKNKLSSSQGAEAQFTIKYATGIDYVEDAISTAVKIGVVERPNTKSYIYRDLKIVGYDNFATELKNNKKLIEELIEETKKKMTEGVVLIPETDDEEEENKPLSLWDTPEEPEGDE
jgi:recombination protein RecA